MIQSQQTGERKLMKKTPKQKTSIYIDKEHLQTIQEMKKNDQDRLSSIVEEQQAV